MDPLRQFIILQPDSLNVLKALGEIFITENRFSEALDTYKRIDNIYPENLDVNLSIAQSYLQLKEYENAINIYKKILLFDDENFEVMIKLGNILNDLGEYHEDFFLNGQKPTLTYIELIKISGHYLRSITI